MKLIHGLILIFLNLYFSAQSTTDYKEYREKQFKLSCVPQDSSIVVDKLSELLLLDTTQFTTNLDWYYQDLGWAYYRSFLYTNDSVLLEKSTITYLKQKELSSSDYWNVMFIYFMLNDCVKGAEYLKLYRHNTPKKFIKSKEEEIARIQKKCGS